MDARTVAWACGVACVALSLFASLHYRRRHRLLHDLPTSKVHGVFIGLVELDGTAECEAPLTSHLAGQRCVLYAWTVEEHWSRTVSYLDNKGHRRTKRESGWKTVAEGGDMKPFYLRDDTGALLVLPADSTRDPVTWLETTVHADDPLYYARGPRAAVADSTGKRRFTEQGFPLHVRLYVLGTASERDDLVAAQISAGSDGQPFLLSTHREERVKAGLAFKSWLAWALGLLVCTVPLALAWREGRVASATVEFAGEVSLAALLAPLAAYVAAWAVGWIWMVFNSLVSLRNRVRQGESLIDVQLKRRHDLIARLVACVAALQTHEQGVQTALAALRNQLAATPPATPGPDFAGLAGVLRSTVERYPELTAQAAFAELHHALVETEQRIALARSYYNEITSHFITRLESLPDRWVARLGGMRPPSLLTAEPFERAPVDVSLAR